MRNLLAFGLVTLLLIVGCSQGQEDAAAEPLSVTSPDDIQALLEKSTRPVVLNIWASWCIPCRSEAPLLERAHQQFGDEIEFVGVNVADTQAGAREFIAEFGLTFENLFDGPRAVPASLGGSGVPLTFFFEPGGELVHYQPGVIDERMLALQIDELLQRMDRG